MRFLHNVWGKKEQGPPMIPIDRLLVLSIDDFNKMQRQFVSLVSGFLITDVYRRDLRMAVEVERDEALR